MEVYVTIWNFICYLAKDRTQTQNVDDRTQTQNVDITVNFTWSIVFIGDQHPSSGNISVFIITKYNLDSVFYLYHITIYRKQQILHGTKLSWFLQIFDKTWKFSLQILMARSNMYCNLAKPRQFSLHSAKKPVNRCTAEDLLFMVSLCHNIYHYINISWQH